MTPNDIIEMAREAGLLFDNTLRAPTRRIIQKQKDLERFASLVAAAEQEACVKMCIRLCDQVDLVGADECIDAIREHFEVKK